MCFYPWQTSDTKAFSTLFFLFYFNRLFATLISYALRAWTWHKYRVYIDIQAVQISILGGRLFFKGIKYHGNNETILIHDGYITWRYWLRRVRELKLDEHAEPQRNDSTDSEGRRSSSYEDYDDIGIEKRNSRQFKQLPCRLDIKIRGLEWFIYNRGAAYDSVLAAIVGEDEHDSEIAVTSDDGDDEGKMDGLKRRIRNKLERNPSKPDCLTKTRSEINLGKPTTLSSSEERVDGMGNFMTRNTSSTAPAVEEDHRKVQQDNILLQFLPIHIECSKAAIVMGNENTKSVLIVKLDKGSGEIDASSCQAQDLYRQLINFELEHPVVQMKPNDDYKEDQTAAAVRLQNGPRVRSTTDSPVKPSKSWYRHLRRKTMHKLKNLVPAFRNSVETFTSSHAVPDIPEKSTSNQWQGLSRYLDDDEQDDKFRWSAIEYATVSTIVDCPKARLSYYWDVPGKVSLFPSSSTTADNQDINGDIAPGFGLNLYIDGALISYGPWADRQRADLQKVFFPSVSKNSKPAKMLQPGQTRVATEFKLYVELEKETTLRVPIREESKNWKWKSQADTMGQRFDDQKKRTKATRKKKNDKGHPGPEIRPFGWLDIKVAANSTIRYSMDMFAGLQGFSNELHIDIPNTEITTSVNHGLLWKSVDQRLFCDLSNPLEWNGMRQWKFDIVSNGLELFILREHIFLLTDLVDDWSGGPPPDYLTFTPFKYSLNLDFGTFRLYLNTNDSNIINNPSDFDDNTFLIIFGTHLNADLCIPIHKFRPYRNDITFDVKAESGGLNLHVPPWNTQATFLTNTEVAVLKDLAIAGKYQYCSTTSPSNTDTLLMDIHARHLQLQLYGFVIRYFLTLKENYFGDHIHFKTLEEHQQLLHQREGFEIDPVTIQPHKKTNDLDVVLTIASDDNCLIIPSNLYSATDHIRVEIATLSSDLRFTNYYMDMQLNLCPLAFSIGHEQDGSKTPGAGSSKSQLYIEDIDVIGHRVFGLPHSEPTYVCNWDFAIGFITGECSTDFLSKLTGGLRSVAFSIDDEENALPETQQVPLHDVTFLRASVKPIHVWLHVDEAAFLLSTGAIEINFDDWAGLYWSKKMALNVPDLTLACVDGESASRHRTRTEHAVETHAFIQTTIAVNMVSRKLGFEEDRELQQRWIRREDSRTHRASFLLHPFVHPGVPDDVSDNSDPPAMCFPPLPIPIESDEGAFDSHSSSVSARSYPSSFSRKLALGSRKSSFLSTATSSQASVPSILRPRRNTSRHLSGQDLPSRSRSKVPLAGQRSKSVRDHSASTGRPPSFYSAIGEPGDKRGLPPSSVTFSSSYITPYFPLDTVEPDLANVPELEISDNWHAYTSVDLSNATINEASFDNHASHTSIVVGLEKGIRAYCNPEAVNAVALLVQSMQAVDPVDIIDVLQIESIKDIFDENKKRLASGSNTDLRVIVPAIHARFANGSGQLSSNPGTEVDQYDFCLRGLTITSRVGIAVTDNQNDSSEKMSRTAMHVRLHSASISAKERFNEIEDTQAAVNLGIEDSVFWMATGEATSINLRIRSVQTSTRSHKVEYLASLIHRTSDLVSDFANKFEGLVLNANNRLQLFTHLVASAGSGTADPLFLTRPSYVLRSAPDHLRMTDSWKIVTRLRYMYKSIDESQKNDIVMRCLGNTEACPANVRQQVLEGFDEWRSWDLENLSDCVVARKIFGSLNEDSSPAGVQKPTSMSFAVDSITVTLDPGPKQNEIAFSSFAIAVNDVPPEHGVMDEASGRGGYPVHTTKINVYCVDTTINLNWELCELAENILKLYSQNLAADEPLSQKVSLPKTVGTGPAREIHMVVATERGSFALDTINLRIRSISKGLKTSVVMIENASEQTKTASLIISAEAATSKVKSRIQELTLSQVRHPSVYVSFAKVPNNGVDNITYTVASTAQELTYVVRQELLVLMETGDCLIGDELARLLTLSKQIPQVSKIKPQNIGQDQQPSAITTVNLAMFLDMYHISFPILSSLTYNISGVVARASVAARLGAEVIFDFDIKENAHDIQTRVESKAKSVSLFQMPPTNGRITSHTSQDEHVISILASVEPLQIDATAIHSLLSTLNRPEMSSVLGEVKDGALSIKAHLQEVLGPEKGEETPKISVDSRQFVYDAHVALAGIHVYADTPGKGKDHARLSFGIESVQLEAANRLNQSGPLLLFPEIRVGLREITFELSRITSGNIEPCGNFTYAAYFTASSKSSVSGQQVRSYHLMSEAMEVNIFADTASTVLDVMGHLQSRFRDLNLSREKQYLQKLRKPTSKVKICKDETDNHQGDTASTNFFTSMYSLELHNIQVSWIVSNSNKPSIRDQEDLVLSFKKIGLSTRKENSAKLTIEDLQLQMVPATSSKKQRSQNSALLPEMIFNVAYVSTSDARRLAFQAAGKSLDLRLTSQFIIPAFELKKSIESASEKVRTASATWTSTNGNGSETKAENKRKPFFGTKRMESLLVDADFAGAVVHLTNRKTDETKSVRIARAPQGGRYGQFSQEDAASSTVLRAPGLAWKAEFKDNGVDDASLNGEIKVDASTNILYPTVVPLILEISSTVKEVVSSEDKDERKSSAEQRLSPQKFMGVDEENILTADPTMVLGRTQLNLGLRICKQEFSLSCQPIARVAAIARFDDIYITVNTVKSSEHGHFFTISSMGRNLQASVQHVYSRESTGSFEVESVVLSVMNSKHVSNTSGISAILNISPTKVLVNAKQLQDFLLFREIWLPPELRSHSAPVSDPSSTQSQTFLVQRYQQVAATGAFPWNATVYVEALDVQLDLGQAIGKSAFMISKFWISSKKNSDWEQNLSMGFDKMGVDSTGRLSGFVDLKNFKVRTSIQWPDREMALSQTPLIQASLTITQFRAKIAFDYQPFLVADITRFEFMMYNVRSNASSNRKDRGDRLVAILDGDSVQVFCTTTTAAQALALYQAFQRLVQEKRSNYETSLKEIERFMKRKSVAPAVASQLLSSLSSVDDDDDKSKSPVSLHTDVVVTLKAVNMGAFPSTFYDQQVFKLEALNAQAKFAVALEDGKIHSALGLTLGQLRIGLAGVRRGSVAKVSADVSVEEVVESATGSRGGTILKVPKVEATMETWQQPDSNLIEFIFKSEFGGKVEVGWNYSRISYIRGMYGNHTRALAQRLGKPLPPSAVKITGVPKLEENDTEDGGGVEREQGKITAEVTVPQSKYEYTALEPSVIETPQLRDMGDATPPLEWIGLHRERLPNLTHQIVIVTLLEIASEVEDAYSKILGSS